MIPRTEHFTEPLDGRKIVALNRLFDRICREAARFHISTYVGDGRNGREVPLPVTPQIVLIVKTRQRTVDAVPTDGAAVAFREGNGITYVFGSGYSQDAVKAVGLNRLILGPDAAVNGNGQSYLCLALA